MKKIDVKPFLDSFDGSFQGGINSIFEYSKENFGKFYDRDLSKLPEISESLRAFLLEYGLYNTTKTNIYLFSEFFEPVEDLDLIEIESDKFIVLYKSITKTVQSFIVIQAGSEQIYNIEIKNKHLVQKIFVNTNIKCFVKSMLFFDKLVKLGNVMHELSIDHEVTSFFVDTSNLQFDDEDEMREEIFSMSPFGTINAELNSFAWLLFMAIDEEAYYKEQIRFWSIMLENRPLDLWV